jgi:long-chain fatty acid transport protein
VKNRFLALLISMACSLLAEPTLAGGLYVPTFGGPSQGTASVGANAIAHDASTAYTNPAGMTRLDSHQTVMALAPGFGTVKFDADDDTPSGGGNGGEQGGFLPISSSSYVHKLTDRWRLGLSLASLSGAGLSPSDNWAGRNEVTGLSLFSVSVLPTVAVRVTDWLSVGGGVLLTYGRVNQKLRVPLPMLPGAPPEATVELKNLDDFATAPVASVLIEPMDGLRLGVTYLDETYLKLTGKIKLPSAVPVGSVGLDLDLPLARTVRTSIYWEATDTIALMMSAGWEDWSTAESLPLSVSMGSAALPLEFRDTWYIGAGTHYQLNDAWTLQAGFRYDSSALKDGDRTTAFPIDRQWSLGVGALHQYSENLRLGLSFQWTDLGKSPVDTARVKGHYKRNDLFLFGVNIAWTMLPWNARGTF